MASRNHDLTPPLVIVASAWMLAGYSGVIPQQAAAMLSAGALSAGGAIALSQSIAKPPRKRPAK